MYIHRETNSIGGIKLNSDENKFSFMFFDTKQRKCHSCESAGNLDCHASIRCLLMHFSRNLYGPTQFSCPVVYLTQRDIASSFRIGLALTYPPTYG